MFFSCFIEYNLRYLSNSYACLCQYNAKGTAKDKNNCQLLYFIVVLFFSLNTQDTSFKSTYNCVGFLSTFKDIILVHV